MVLHGFWRTLARLSQGLAKSSDAFYVVGSDFGSVSKRSARFPEAFLSSQRHRKICEGVSRVRKNFVRVLRGGGQAVHYFEWFRKGFAPFLDGFSRVLERQKTPLQDFNCRIRVFEEFISTVRMGRFEYGVERLRRRLQRS